jgi:hypothetical protein
MTSTQQGIPPTCSKEAASHWGPGREHDNIGIENAISVKGGCAGYCLEIAKTKERGKGGEDVG